MKENPQASVLQDNNNLFLVSFDSFLKIMALQPRGHGLLQDSPLVVSKASCHIQTLMKEYTKKKPQPVMSFLLWWSLEVEVRSISDPSSNTIQFPLLSETKLLCPVGVLKL